MQFIYQNLPQTHVDVMLVFDASVSFNAVYDGFVPSVNSAGELIQRMRVNDRVGVIKLGTGGVLPLRTIAGDADRAAALTTLSGLVPDGTSEIGGGFQSALSQWSTASPSGNTKAVILFSAGDESGSPRALDLVPSLRTAGVHVYTMGFPGSLSGQYLTSQIADTTHGAYYLAADSTINQVVRQIWDRLTGIQLIGDTSFASNSPAFRETT